MQEKKEILKNIAITAISTGLAITTQGSSSLILGALSGIAGGIASDFLQKNDFNQIKNLLKETHPSDLNHDLQKVIVQAVEWSILNIQILYKGHLNGDKKQITALETFTENLISEVSLLKGMISNKGDAIYKVIENPDNDANLFNTFDFDVATFPIIKKEKPYNIFFKENFKDNLQLCFGELLKKEKNRPAYIAYQRANYKNLENSVEKLITQNKQLLQKIDDKDKQEVIKQETNNWVEIKTKLTNTPNNKISSAFEISFNNHLYELKKDTKLLVDITKDIQDEVGKIKDIVKDFGKDLKQNWISKNKVKVFSFATIAVLVILALFYKLNTTPFTMNIGIEVDNSIKVDNQYPKLSKEARIQFYLPNKTIEKEITFNNEMILTDISNTLKNTKCKVKLTDKHWQLTADSLILNNGNFALKIKPNETLAYIKGQVKTYITNKEIQDVTIKVAGLKTHTDKNGYFNLKMPVALRKIQYILKIEKADYISQELEYYAGSSIEIRLNKTN